MSGVKTKLEIPYLKNLIDAGDVVINKAELQVVIENATDATYPAIEMLSLVSIDASGQSVFLPDISQGLDFFGGSLDNDTKTYTFNLPRHTHNMIYNPSSDYGMYLIATGQSITANRSVITSNKNTVAKLKLIVTYTKI